VAVNTIDYTLNFDTSKLSSTAYEVRSILSTTLGGAASGVSSFMGAASGAAHMMGMGMNSGFSQVRSFTDPAMAYQSHYGIIGAESQLSREWAAYSRGPVGVAGFTPPGVGAAAYSQRLMENFYSRRSEATAGFMRGALPEAVSSAVGFAAFKVGGAAASAMGMGFAGTAALGFVAPMAIAYGTHKFATEAIARGDRMAGEVTQLGKIVTEGRGLGVATTQEYGVGLSKIADRMSITKPELGDIVSGIRGMGMMPRTGDVKESLSQFEGMAKDIHDIAVGMQTSLGNATRYLKNVEQMGLGKGSSGVFAAAGMAEGLGTSLGGLISHVGQGRRIGMATGVGAGTGGGVYLQSAFAGAQGLGSLTGGEQLMVGGAMGLGRSFGRHAMQNALGSMGQMQLMAMMGSQGAQGLPGSMMGTLNQAAQNMFSGGNAASNLLNFSNNRTRMLGQLGATGIRQMQAHGISTQAQMFMKMFPGVSEQAAIQHIAMGQGMSEHVARGMSGYIMRGYHDRRPSAAVAGMPGVFGSSRVSAMARRADYDRAAKSAAHTEEGIFSRGTRYFGEIWRDFRLRQKRLVEQDVTVKMAENGYIKPSNEASEVVSRMMRTGRGSGIDAQVKLTSESGRLQVNAALMFGGQEGTFGRISAGRYRKALHSTAENVYKSLSLSKKERGVVDKSMETISGRVTSKSLDVGKLVKDISRASSGMAKGKGGSLNLFSSRMKTLFKGTPLEKEFEKHGFGGKHGAAMMVTVNRLMKNHGQGAYDIGKVIQSVGSRGVAAIAGAQDIGLENLYRRMSGGASIEKEALKLAKQVAAKRNAQQFHSFGGGEESPFSRAYSGASGKPTSAEIDAARAIIVKRSGHNTGQAKKDYRRIIQHPKMAEYVKYFAKENRTEAEGKKMSAAKKAIFMTEMHKGFGVGAVKEVMKHVQGNAKGLAKDIAKYGALAKAKSRRKRRRSGTRISMATGKQGFESRVAQAIVRTGHTLVQVQKAMSALEGRLKKGNSK